MCNNCGHRAQGVLAIAKGVTLSEFLTPMRRWLDKAQHKMDARTVARLITDYVDDPGQQPESVDLMRFKEPKSLLHVATSICRQNERINRQSLDNLGWTNVGISLHPLRINNIQHTAMMVPADAVGLFDEMHDPQISDLLENLKDTAGSLELDETTLAKIRHGMTDSISTALTYSPISVFADLKAEDVLENLPERSHRAERSFSSLLRSTHSDELGASTDTFLNGILGAFKVEAESELFEETNDKHDQGKSVFESGLLDINADLLNKQFSDVISEASPIVAGLNQKVTELLSKSD